MARSRRRVGRARSGESVSCPALPARQNCLGTGAARHPGVGRGEERRGTPGHKTRHDEPRLPKFPPMMGNQTGRAHTHTHKRARAHTHTHSHTRTHSHSRAKKVLLALAPSTLISTPKARDESDPWKIKIDEGEDNKNHSGVLSETRRRGQRKLPARAPPNAKPKPKVFPAGPGYKCSPCPQGFQMEWMCPSGRT